jgi:aminopeptidase N
MNVILGAVDAILAGRSFDVPQSLVRAFARLLADAPADPAFAAEAIALPGEGYIAEQLERVDPDAIHSARNQVRRALARGLRPEFEDLYDAMTAPGHYSPDAESAGKRALRNASLSYLMELEEGGIRRRCVAQFREANNMTDRMAALAALANCECPERPQALADFYRQWKDEPLVVDKWLAVQASSRLPGTLEEVRRLARHPAFELKNPNKVYSLIRTFAANHARFHAADGGGYEFLAEQILALDPLNPQVAARMARAFDRWRKFDDGRQGHARAALTHIRDAAGLSPDVYEVVSKALA